MLSSSNKFKWLLSLTTKLFFVLISSILFWYGFKFSDSTYYILGLMSLIIASLFFVQKKPEHLINVPKLELKRFFSTSLHEVKKLKINLSIDKKYFKVNKLLANFLSLGLSISILLITIIFILPATNNNSDLFRSTIESIQLFLNKTKYLPLAVFPLIILVNFVYQMKSKKNKIKSKFKIVFNSILQILISFPLAIVFTFLVAFIYANSILFVSNISPNSLKLYTDKDKIRETINSSDLDFKLIGVSESPSKSFVTNFQLLGIQNTFFNSNLIYKFDNRLFINSKSVSKPIYLYKDTIFIKDLDKELIESISPTLVKKLVKKNLSPRYIKDEPNVKIISRQEYLKYREEQINKQIEEIAGYIEESKKILSNYSYQIGVAKNNISRLQGYIQLNSQYRDSEYNECVNSTYTYYGYYSNYTYRRYSDQYCQSQKDQRNTQNAQYESEIRTNQQNLSYYQSLYSEFKGYLDQFVDYKVFIEMTKQQTPYELGLFEPENSVKVVLDSTGEKDISNFIVTLTHEYLHYSSYVSEERTLPQFFEEGLTEHFARKIVSDQLSRDTNLGYPLISKMISEISKKVNLKELEDIYFTKSEDQLQTLLDNAYGKGFYEDSSLYFALIPLSPNEEALKFANNIMVKIGGSELSEKDLYSDF